MNTTSTLTVEQPKCNICKDTGWVTNYTDMSVRKCKCVDIEYLKRLWERSGINADKTHMKFSNYKPYDDLTNNILKDIKAYVENFEKLKSARENWFGLFGQAGAGKTHIVIAAGSYLLTKKKQRVVYMPYIESIRHLKGNAKDEEYYTKLLSRYLKAELLIVDDLFKDKVKKGKLIWELKETDMKHIYPILNYRYNNFLPTIISTECTPEMLMDLDEALAGRILQRCGDNLYIFKNKKYNYRMRSFIKTSKRQGG